MSDVASLNLGDKTVELPIIVGTENEHAVDITKLRAETGFITGDSGYGNTGACKSSICFINGEQGILRYRGYPIDQLATQASFLEVAWLLIHGELPTQSQLSEFEAKITQERFLNERVKHHFEGYPSKAHPMAVLSSMINTTSCFHPELQCVETEDQVLDATVKLLAKITTIASFAYKSSKGEPYVYPDAKLDYCENFLHMMFGLPFSEPELDKEVVDALNMILILHAEHEQNCSTSTVRMVGSSGANLFAGISAGIGALWGPLHGGANVAVLDMLEELRSSNANIKEFMERVKTDKTVRLMGFGHRVYKNFDPRAKILKGAADTVLAKLGVNDPLLEIAQELEAIALADDYFVQRKLYPNVDFYSGIIMRAMGIPTDMFTVMFAIGRLPGWIAHYYEQFQDPKARISRPRQVYTGATERDYVAIDQRG